MKLLNRFLLLSTLLFVAFSCSPEENVEESRIEISIPEISISEIGGTSVVKLTATSPWQAKVSSSASEWLTLTPENGPAGESLNISVSASTYQNGETKEGVIEFTLLDGKSTSLKVMRGDVVSGRTTDSLSLVALYNATGGERFWRNPWDLNSSMSNWEGVSLETYNGELRVTRLMMQERNMRGELPEQLMYLDQLRQVTFEANYLLTGEFPTFLLENKKIQLLNLGDNKFTGSIPSSVFDLEDLTWLILKNNQFSGEIPQNIGNATNLVTLYLDGNNFTGSVPSSLENLVNLEYLSLASNSLSGELPSFNQMSSLTELDLSSNAIYEEINLGQFPDLQPNILANYISGGFSGSAPSLENLSKLKQLVIGVNNFSSSPEVINCPSLTLIDLNRNPITTLDKSLLNSSTIEEIYAYDTKLSYLPEVTISNSAIKILALNNSELEVIPSSLSKLSNLEQLFVQNNKLSNLPEGLSEIKTLVLIQAGYNNITSLPSDFWNVTSLNFLSIPCNPLVATLPSNPEEFEYLSILNINCCQFEGEVSSLWSLPRISEIHASQNNFSGEIAGTEESKSALKRHLYVSLVTLDDNNLTGNLPEELMSVDRLTTLHLYNNKLSGVVSEKFYTSNNWCSWGPMNFIKPGNDDLIMQDVCAGS